MSLFIKYGRSDLVRHLDLPQDPGVEEVAAAAADAANVLDRIESSLREHTGGGERSDDVTLLAVRRVAEAESRATESESRAATAAGGGGR